MAGEIAYKLTADENQVVRAYQRVAEAVGGSEGAIKALAVASRQATDKQTAGLHQADEWYAKLDQRIKEVTRQQEQAGNAASARGQLPVSIAMEAEQALVQYTPEQASVQYTPEQASACGQLPVNMAAILA